MTGVPPSCYAMAARPDDRHMRHPFHVTICLGVAVAAGLWGLYWLPQRELAGAGLTGGWGTMAQFVIPLFAMIPVMAWRAAAHGKVSGARWGLVGLLSGGGIVCYAYSFLLTDVVRALLLFYLTPVWTTLLERMVLGYAVSPRRWLGLAFALAGAFLVFGQDSGLPLPANAGDWLALAGGAMVAGAAARVDARNTVAPLPLLFAFYLYGSAAALVLGWLLAEELGPVPDPAALLPVLPYLLILVFVLMMPSNALLIWSPAKIGAGVFGILLMAEILTGSVSAAAWAGERFAWREVAGCVLIVVAGATAALGPGPAAA